MKLNMGEDHPDDYCVDCESFECFIDCECMDCTKIEIKKEHIIYDYIDKLPCRICDQKIYGRWILNYKHVPDNNICYACFEQETKK